MSLAHLASGPCAFTGQRKRWRTARGHRRRSSGPRRFFALLIACCWYARGVEGTGRKKPSLPNCSDWQSQNPTSQISTMLKTFCLAMAALLGTAAVANGVYMLVAPESWYFAVPGDPTTGPFNQHFIRDIGLIFLFLGGAFLTGVARPDLRVAFWRRPRSGSLAMPCSTSGKWRSARSRLRHPRATFPPSRCLHLLEQG